MLAIPAVSTAAAQPGHAHALTRMKPLTPAPAPRPHPRSGGWDQRQRRFSQFAVHHMQVGAADAAGGDSRQQLARPGLRCWQLLQLQGSPGRTSTIARILCLQCAADCPAEVSRIWMRA